MGFFGVFIMAGQIIVTYPMIGFSSYQYNGKEGFFLNVIEDYEMDDKQCGGSMQTAVSAPYEELSKVKGVSMSLAFPATIEFKGRFQSRGNTTTIICDEIVKITPFKSLKETQLSK